MTTITKYYYEDANNASLVTHTVYPDSSSTPTSGTDLVKLEWNLDGSLKTRTDQRSVVLAYTYDTARRLAREGATTIPSGVDSTIQSIARTYDSLGRPEKVTSYSAADGTGTVHNEIQFAYNSSHGKLEYMYQSHQGAVSTSTTPKLQLTYDTSVTTSVYNNGLRVQNTYYPAATGSYNYFSYHTTDGIFDRLSRVYEQKLFGGNLNGNLDRTTGYRYNGTGRLVWVGGLRALSMRSSGTSQDFDRLDRFGRTLSQVWDNGSSPATVYDQTDYTYDTAGNRLTRNVATTTNDTRDQLYTHDGLQRLKNVDQGTLSGGTIASPAQEQDWGLDQLGNWATFDEKASGSYTLQQQRYHNGVNEIDGNGGNSITLQSGGAGSNWADPAYDLAGNMTTMPQPAAPTATFTLKYDAWNRLVEVRDGSNSLVQQSEYDGLNRRIVRVDAVPSPDVTYDYYYNDQWQLLTEVKDGTADAIYQWHPYYIDALNLRMRATDMHWFTHDANFNVTAALLDSTAAVVERYSYTPYGAVTFLDPTFGIRASSLIANTHLYTGRELDPETGLQLNRHRVYHPPLGRWTTQDWIRYGGGMNLYGYINGQPTIYVDPSGFRRPPGFWEHYFYYCEWGNCAPADPAWMNWGSEVGDVASLAGGGRSYCSKVYAKSCGEAPEAKSDPGNN